MAGSITDATRLGQLSYRYEWSGTVPFQVYAYGRLFMGDTDQTFLEIGWDTDTPENRLEPPPIEVIDSTQTAVALKQVLHPPVLEFQFRGRTDAVFYRVELSADNGATWPTFLDIAEDGRGYYRVSGYIAFTITTKFRVSSFDAMGIQSDYMQFDIFHHAVNSPEHLTYTYDSGTGDVTIEAA